MPDTERKTLRASIKDDEKGIVTAVFAKLGVMDLDGDITLPGAFGSQKVGVSAYGHNSWSGALPIGRGTISEKDGEAVAELKLFMTTENGREHFEVIKGMGDLQEWSYGFDVKETGEVTEELRQQGVRRVLKKLKVHEVSPVLRGAGIDTRTTAVKCESCGANVPTQKGDDMETKSTELGNLLKQLRDEKELSNGDLAESMGFSATIVGHIINGEPHRISLKRLESAAAVLGTSLSRLRAAAESDGVDYADEDNMRRRAAYADEAKDAALKARELATSAAVEAKASIAATTVVEKKAALERAEVFQEEAEVEFERLNRNMERHQA